VLRPLGAGVTKPNRSPSWPASAPPASTPSRGFAVFAPYLIRLIYNDKLHEGAF